MALGTVAENGQFEVVQEAYPQESMVTLQPLAIRVFNSHGVYSPSKLRPKKEIGSEEFFARYANNSVEIRVCFDQEPSEDTILDRSVPVKAYGLGLDCWYIVAAFEDAENQGFNL